MGGIICAIKLFWGKTLHHVWPQELELARANPQFKLPVILSAAEVRIILSHVPLLDDRVCLITRQLQVNLGHTNPLNTVIYTHLTSLYKTQHQQRLDSFMADL